MLTRLPDETKDLELMLSPLRRLPALSGIAGDIAPYLAQRPEPLEVTITLELDRHEPTIDFVRQLFELAYQVSTTGGVAIPPAALLVARRLVRHAETVADAWRTHDAIKT